MSENLWLKAARDYLRDPKNVFGAPGDFTRRLFKFSWLILSFYILFYVAGPTQVASWRLWLEDDELAAHVAWGFTLASFLAFAIVRYAYQGTPAWEFRMPLAPDSWGWRWRMAGPTVLAGFALAFGLFAISLLGMWNYYLHEQLKSGGAASIASIASSATLDQGAEARAALAAFEARAARSLAIIDQAIADTPAGSPTGRSRLVRERADTERAQAVERAQLAAAVQAARNGAVRVAETRTDTRPVDEHVAGALGAERRLVASLLDLMRSGIVELLLVMGAGLGLVVAPSRAGVPKQAEASADEAEPADPPPAPDPDSAPDLPTLADWRAAVDEDFEQRAVVVDEHGRAMQRVQGHWRPARAPKADERPAPASRTDRRRVEPPTQAPTPPAHEDIASLADEILARQQERASPEKETAE